jgi:hypothetical protein
MPKHHAIRAYRGSRCKASRIVKVGRGLYYVELHLHIYRHSIYVSVSSPLNRRLACPGTRLVVVARRKDLTPLVQSLLPELPRLVRMQGHVLPAQTEREKLGNRGTKWNACFSFQN